MNKVNDLRSENKDVLRMFMEASGLNLESAVIIGVESDGTVHLSSNAKDNLKLIGAIETAKMHVYEGW